MQTKVTKLYNYSGKTGPKIDSKETEVLRINHKSNNKIPITGQHKYTKTLCNEKSETCKRTAVKINDGNLLTKDSERRKNVA